MTSAPKHAPSIQERTKDGAQSMVDLNSALQHVLIMLEGARCTVISMMVVLYVLKHARPTMGGGKTGAMLDAGGIYCVLAADSQL